MSRAWHHREEAQLVRGAARELVAPRAHFVPVVLALPLDRVRHGQVRGRVAGSLLFVPRNECRVVAFVAPAEDEWVHFALAVASHVEERRTLRRGEPLVTVAGVEVRVEL